jgi:hypothetical protein
MTDRHALFSHYYFAVWCLNVDELRASPMVPPSEGDWSNVLFELQLT